MNSPVTGNWEDFVVQDLVPYVDAIWDHVYSNQAFTHELNEFGIVHEAEEYNGVWDANPYWGASWPKCCRSSSSIWNSSRDSHRDFLREKSFSPGKSAGIERSQRRSQLLRTGRVTH